MIDEGTRAIIELTAERAAKAAVREHMKACPIAAQVRELQAAEKRRRWYTRAAIAAGLTAAATAIADFLRK